MANGPGVSVSEDGERWRVRWREWVELEDGRRVRRQRQQSCTTKAAAIELQASVLRAIEAGRVWKPAAELEDRVAHLDQVGIGWLRWMATMRGARPRTIGTYAHSWGLFVSVVRHLERLQPGQVVPVSVLSRDLFARVAGELQAPTRGRVIRYSQKRVNGRIDQVERKARPLAPSTVYGHLSRAHDAWAWAAGDLVSYPGTPAAAVGCLPAPPVYVAPTAPTMAEVDACIRHLSSRASSARVAAIVMRYTGLRVSQVLQLREDDLDRQALTLHIRPELGKTKRERAGRVLPVPRALLVDLAPYLDGSPFLVPRRVHRLADGSSPRASQPSRTLREAWARATKAGECRLEVWNPPGRRGSRPDHAFRAALQAHLDGQQVRETAIDALVGHAPTTTRRKHYAPVSLAELRQAVELIPPIDWRVELEGVLELPRR